MAWAQPAAHGQVRAQGPTVWLHAPSVGEVMAALPVIHRLRRAHPGMRCVLTHTSPSVVGWTFDGVDHADYLPLDEPAHIGPVVGALRPNLMLFSRGDLWPELVDVVAARNVPIAVTGGTLSTRSGRLRWPFRTVLARAAGSIGYLGTVTLGDAGRWRRLGVRPDVIHMTGDPRQDHVLERPVDGRVAARLRTWGAGAPILVAGSTESEDEAPLAHALARILPDTGARALVIPHDPSKGASRLANRLRTSGVPVGSPTSLDDDLSTDHVIVIGQRGVLFDSYLAADVAFVGGGYRRHGLHSVIEPAAFGLPVTFGREGRNDRDAAHLLATGAAVSPSRTCDLATILRTWLTETAARSQAGRAARAAVCGGAASADAEGIGALMR